MSSTACLCISDWHIDAHGWTWELIVQDPDCPAHMAVRA